MKTESKLITPEWAQQKLNELQKQIEAGEFKQRNPRQRAIQRYAADMEAGKWLLTHQGIAFDEAGHLLDGQNRLWAVVKANVPVQMMVTTGLTRSGKLAAMDVIDGGMTRSLANHLQLSHGYGPESHEASALVKGIVTMVFASTAGVGHKTRSGFQVSTQEALFILEDLGFVSSLERFRALAQAKKTRHRSLASCWCWYHLSKPAVAESFLRDFVTLENLKAKSAPLVLNRFFRDLTKRARKNDAQLLKSVANAIFDYDKDEPVSELRGNKEALEWLIGLQAKKAEKIVQRISP